MKLNQRLRTSLASACLIALILCLLAAVPNAGAQQKAPAQPLKIETITEKAIHPVAASSAELEAWHVTMHHTRAPRVGCFHASYPATQWQEVKCAPPPGWRSAKPRIRKGVQGGHVQVGGDTGTSTDIVAQAPTGHFFSKVVGSFPMVNGVTSETGVGVALYGGGGVLGSNEYSLQINTNMPHTSACGSYSYCYAWQQYVMATNTFVSLTSSTLTNETQVFIEYWLFNYGVDNGTNICPSGFLYDGADSVGPGADCIQNGSATTITAGQLPITNLAGLTFSATATSGGTDDATVTYGGEAYIATVPDSYTDIASGWNQAEFNVVGNAGGSQAQFNNGSSMIVKVEVTDGSSTAPSCVYNSGTTGESNNFNFIPSTASPVCCQYGGTDPNIEFMEAYDTTHTHTASCGGSSITGEPHITTVDGTYYNFQAAGEFIALQDPGGTEIQTRQTPLPTVAPGNYDPGNKNNDNLVSCLAMNTAVAARVGTHRVTYEPSFGGAYGSGPYQLRIDGKLTTLNAQGVNLGGGAMVKNSVAGEGIEVDFPDGKIMTAIPSEKYDNMQLLNIQFENLGVVTEAGGKGELGIAGEVPKGSWLPALPNGASVGPMPPTLHQRYVTLYNTFGNAWRVTNQNTLFDYAPGTSTTTFTNTKWPVENATTCTIPNQPVMRPVSAAVAEEACKTVTDDKLHAGCLFDVQATGQTGYAKTYKASENVRMILRVKPIDARIIAPVIREERVQ